MRSPRSLLAGLAIFAPLCLSALPSGPRALDEGMWTFDSPPLELLAERYGFKPTEQWLEHLRLASVRLNDGGSGSFISPHGLVLTNHHVGHEAIEELSTKERNLVRDGFLARTEAEELACPDLELNVLMSIEDVTSRVLGAVKSLAHLQPRDETKPKQAHRRSPAQRRSQKVEARRIGSDVHVVERQRVCTMGSIASRRRRRAPRATCASDAGRS